MPDANSKTLIVIVGATAVGKTEAAIRAAQEFSAEIVSADSRQIYKELSIGTAKPSMDQLKLVNHHFVDHKSISQNYDAGEYGREALGTITELFRAMNVVILCGGSGLYVRAVCEGFDEMPDLPDGLRSNLVEQYQQNGINWLQEQLRTKDPEYFSVVDIYNPHRLIRALELIEAGGQPIGQLRRKAKLNHPFNVVKIGLELDREELYSRINSRVDAMMANGLLDEARQFHDMRQLNALQTVGYKEIFGYLDGQHDLDEAVRLIKRNTRRYAKRQLTWFKKDSDIDWFNANDYEGMLKHLKEKGIE